jgi:hypothetical protein
VNTGRVQSLIGSGSRQASHLRRGRPGPVGSGSGASQSMQQRVTGIGAGLTGEGQTIGTLSGSVHRRQRGRQSEETGRHGQVASTRQRRRSSAPQGSVVSLLFSYSTALKVSVPIKLQSSNISVVKKNSVRNTAPASMPINI